MIFFITWGVYFLHITFRCNLKGNPKNLGIAKLIIYIAKIAIILINKEWGVGHGARGGCWMLGYGLISDF
jgi:hypothetical protein